VATPLAEVGWHLRSLVPSRGRVRRLFPEKAEAGRELGLIAIGAWKVRRRPDFLIVGAAKAGSTWIVRCLREHPQVFIPEREIHYFTRGQKASDDLSDAYLKRFAAAQREQVVGENSNSYLSDPAAARRIAACLPDAKLLAMLRHPVERAYSGYCMQVRVGRASTHIESYLDPASARLPHVLEVGLYYKHLSRYLELFPRERIHVEIFEDIRGNPEVVFDRVCGFLEVKSGLRPELLRRKVNAGNVAVAPPALQRWLARGRLGRRAVAALSRSAVYRLARPAIARRFPYPELPLHLRRRLIDYYREDIQELSRLLGRDLDEWLR